MPYDERLAQRIREALGRRSDITEKKMFGGLAFLCGGRMCCGVTGTDLVVRVRADELPRTLKQRHVRPMDFTGRPLRGFVYVAPGGYATAANLGKWIDRGLRFVHSDEAPRATDARGASSRGTRLDAENRESSQEPRASPDVDPRFARVAKAFARNPEVTYGKMFASMGLKVSGKIFAMFVKGRFVTKLPKERVNELVRLGTGAYFDPGHGRLMKEWVALEGAEDLWLDLAREAKRFVERPQ